ncbi:MAG TPA: class I SAM-dependent methyltransferase [Firmicutes bacterium]|nr:class I SAM-dependent methyltransferase [Bacillota bacterium]
MTETENRPKLYQNTDLDSRDIVRADIPFYLEYAKNYPGPILELACGTGRLARALARRGHFVHGPDLSKGMRKQVQRRLANEPREVRKRVKLEFAAMADFSLKQKVSRL